MNIEKKNTFVKNIGNTYEKIGFVALRGHFLDTPLIESLYGEIQKFFDLPLSKKLNYEIEGIGGQRGDTSFVKESAKESDEVDLKEFWDFGQQLSKDYPYLKTRTKETRNFLCTLKKQLDPKNLINPGALGFDEII